MARIDLHKLALRLKVVEMIQLYLRQRLLENALRLKAAALLQVQARRRLLENASQYWKRLIHPN